MKRLLPLLFPLVGLPLRRRSQALATLVRNGLDSLRHLLATASVDTNRVKLLNLLAIGYRNARPGIYYRLGYRAKL
jgi:hypothetical protein